MNKQHQEQLLQISQQFIENAPVLQAIGDETRQHIIMCMMELPGRAEGGTRVGAITAKTYLSRPAVSHHIKILKDVGIVGMRSEGTKNYYYLTNEHAKLDALLALFQNVLDLSKKMSAEQASETP